MAQVHLLNLGLHILSTSLYKDYMTRSHVWVIVRESPRFPQKLLHNGQGILQNAYINLLASQYLLSCSYCNVYAIFFALKFTILLQCVSPSDLNVNFVKVLFVCTLKFIVQYFEVNSLHVDSRTVLFSV